MNEVPSSIMCIKFLNGIHFLLAIAKEDIYSTVVEATRAMEHSPFIKVRQLHPLIG